MWKKLIAGAILLTSMAAQTASRSPAPTNDFRALTDAEMKAVLPGSYIKEIVPAHLQDLSTDEQFNVDGTYLRYADNREIEGRYVIGGGKDCVKDEFNREYCRILAVDRVGQYLMGVPTYLVPVSITRLRDGASVPSVRLP